MAGSEPARGGVAREVLGLRNLVAVYRQAGIRAAHVFAHELGDSGTAEPHLRLCFQPRRRKGSGAYFQDRLRGAGGRHADRPWSRARTALATSSLVALGRSEPAISMLPRVSAPRNSRAMVSGSSTRSRPASRAARSRSAIAAKANRSS